MAYPKPLSKKTIDKMYLDSGLTEEKITFLRRLFDGAAALYGVITLDVKGEEKAKLTPEDLFAKFDEAENTFEQ